MNLPIINPLVAAIDKQSPRPITSNYLLIINIPLYRDGVELLAGDLWFKDLAGHLSYLKSLTIACPVLDVSAPGVSLPLSSDDRFAAVGVIDLPAADSFLFAVLALPRVVIRLWSAIRNADIVHTGVAGWPIPYGWFVTPIAKILRKKLVIIVESAPWRLNASRKRTLKAKVSSSVFEMLARWCISSSDLAIFTQENYRMTLLRNSRKIGHVIHASWIDEEVIISDEEAHKIWKQKLKLSPPELLLLFAGRLDRQKGLAVLLDAMRLVAQKNLRVTLDILGSGELEPICRDVSKELSGSTCVRVLGSVSYGAPLFQLLRGYHAVILPSISDEQPRIVYDAYSQALPVLATRTVGLQACVVENQTGWFAEPNNVDELSRIIERAASNLDEISAMGMEAVCFARLMTHQQMHRRRQQLLLDLIVQR